MAAVFDPAARHAAVVAGGWPESDPVAWTRLARERAAAPDLPAEETWAAADWTPDWSRADYEARVRRVLDYIRAGDIFQANLAQRFTAPRPAGMTPFGLFRRLCRINPAPFAAFLSVARDRAVVSASPKRFLRVAPGARHVETRPIKGTRPRGRTPDEDAALAAELLSSAKDRAENLMIVDLLRNDLARTSVAGSVRVPELWRLDSHAGVHHLVSEVTAEPRPGVTALDILRRAFPGDLITGAPKIRAMEIIHELEDARRGPYCGAIGWISDDGVMDTAIAIRTVVDGDILTVSAGGRHRRRFRPGGGISGNPGQGGGAAARADPRLPHPARRGTIAMPDMIHLNGRLMPASETRIAATDRGFLLGDGLFETLRVRDGRAVAVHRHLARLAEGLAFLGFPPLPRRRFPWSSRGSPGAIRSRHYRG